MKRVFLAFLIVICAAACGRYAAPLPPKAFSPKPVDKLVAQATVSGMSFSWEAPSRDLRGKELRSMDGYRVYRKELKLQADVIDNKAAPYELLVMIPDTHVDVRDQLREEAVAAGKISRRVKVNPDLLKFSYADTTPEAGKTYLYKIVPVNQGDTEGQPGPQVRVLFRGVSSVINQIPADAADDELFSE